MEKISKEFLGLAGEYAVASELCKRGLYAQLTLGHHKSTNLKIASSNLVGPANANLLCLRGK